MRAAEIKRISETQRTGSYISIKYSSTPTLKAAAKRSGVDVRKITSKTVRLGCNYSHMSKVIEAKENGRGTREMYEAPIIDNLLYENTKNGQLYLRVGNVDNNNVTTYWLINGEPATIEEVMEHVVPSYFPEHKKEIPEVQNIKIENVISLGR